MHCSIRHSMELDSTIVGCMIQASLREQVGQTNGSLISAEGCMPSRAS